MSPRDQKILKTLELLVMLKRSKRQFSNVLTDEQMYTLMISKQFISDAGLTIPEFTNSVEAVSEKGYIFHIVIFDDNLRSQVDEFVNSSQYNEALEKLKELDTEENSNMLKLATQQQFSQFLPSGVEFDQDEIDRDSFKLTDVVEFGINKFKDFQPDDIGFILLMPFRDIETLLTKMNSGKKFDDIQDDGFWYDNSKFEFHIDGEVITTSSRGLPNLSHTVLSLIFNNPPIYKVEYEQMPNFDPSKGNEAYRDAMRKFIKKHPKLEIMFSVHLYDTEFNPDSYSEIP